MTGPIKHTGCFLGKPSTATCEDKPPAPNVIKVTYGMVTVDVWCRYGMLVDDGCLTVHSFSRVLLACAQEYPMLCAYIFICTYHISKYLITKVILVDSWYIYIYLHEWLIFRNACSNEGRYVQSHGSCRKMYICTCTEERGNPLQSWNGKKISLEKCGPLGEYPSSLLPKYFLHISYTIHI